MGDDAALTVGELNEYVRRLLAGDRALRSIRLRGEISNYKRHISGHRYFSLKDDEARVQCAMFRQNAQRLDFEPRDGMRVILTGAVSLYVRDGAYQVYCDSIRREGLGDLFLRFEQLKRKLEAEGLFDAALKRPLPAYPRVLGVVTSPTGAALRDILRVAYRRNPKLAVLVAPAQVQGEGAAREIAEAIRLLNADGRAEVILCGRGGGSAEDLWAFNEEAVARAIAESRIPIVSCVGHETDFTLSDFVADLRAPTPSAAAELATPVIGDALAALSEGLSRLDRGIGRALRGAWNALRAQASSPALRAPKRRLIDPAARELSEREGRLGAAADAALGRGNIALSLMERSLAGLNPESPLARGYAIVRRGGRAIDRAAALRAGDAVELTLRDGTAEASVESVAFSGGGAGAG